jgi:hypothetical protein
MLTYEESARLRMMSKNARARRLQENSALLKVLDEAGILYRHDTKYKSVYISILGGALTFYLTTGKWVHSHVGSKRVYKGNYKALIVWMGKENIRAVKRS